MLRVSCGAGRLMSLALVGEKLADIGVMLVDDSPTACRFWKAVQGERCRGPGQGQGAAGEVGGWCRAGLGCSLARMRDRLRVQAWLAAGRPD